MTPLNARLSVLAHSVNTSPNQNVRVGACYDIILGAIVCAFKLQLANIF